MDGRIYVSPNQYRQIADDMDRWGKDSKHRVLPRVCLMVAAKWLRARAEGQK